MIRFLEAYFHMALVASIVTILILLIRPIFKKFSNRIACLLWAVVFFRLLCPFTIERPAILNGDRYESALAKSVDISVDSMQNTEIADRLGDTALHSNEEMELPAYRLNASGKESASDRQSVALTDQRITGNVTAGSANIENANIENANIENANIESANIGNTSRAEDVHKRKTVSGVVLAIQKRLSRCKDAGYVFLGSMLGKAILGVVGSIWLFGAIAFFVIGCIKYRRTAKKLQSAVFMGIRNKYPVKISDIQGTPLSFGILHPAIYVPACFSDRSGKRRMCPVERTNGEIREELCLSDEWQEMILWHEEMHLRHHDPLWKVISFIALCAHWWNPLVWLAIRCMNQDLEMACDEAVLEKIGQDKKTDYATTLLEFATSRGGISLAAAFGESHAERRIVNVIKYRKAPVWLSVVLSVSVLALGGCLATTAAQSGRQEELLENKEISDQMVGTEEAGEGVNDDSVSVIEPAANEGTVVVIDETHFPDPAFRDYVKKTYDTNQDGVLSEDEILAVTEMKCGNMGIGSLKGVEIFSNLEKLDCRKNDLTDLDISKNTKLRCLACSETGINTLDITNCPRLICVRAVGSCYASSTFEAYGGYLDEEKDLSISLCESLLQVNEDAKIVPECEPEKGWDISCMFTDIREERWKEIYLELIENCLCDNDMTETVPYAVEKYAFLYLNDDSVPELVAIGTCEANGTQIFSIANGKVISMRTARRGFFYKERGNILDNRDGNMGYYYDKIWKIGENGFERVHNCENEVYEWDDDMHPTKQEFWIDDQPVSEQEYCELIEELIPSSEERVYIDPYPYALSDEKITYMTRDEIREKLAK